MKRNRTLDKEPLRYPLHVRRISDRTMEVRSFARWWSDWTVAVCLRGNLR